jgi:hypothetical protein
MAARGLVVPHEADSRLRAVQVPKRTRAPIGTRAEATRITMSGINPTPATRFSTLINAPDCPVGSRPIESSRTSRTSAAYTIHVAPFGRSFSPRSKGAAGLRGVWLSGTQQDTQAH